LLHPSLPRRQTGVHACAQVCSLKLELPEDDWEAHNDNKTEEERLDGPRQRLQKNLPDDICVLSMSRTTRNFCAKTQRDRVRYQYMIPSFLLHPDWRTIMTEQGVDIINSGREARENYSKMPLSVEVAKKVQLILREYRSTEDSRDLLQSALRKYEGTHPFHNFTKGIKPGQPQGKRYIESFDVSYPVIVDGMEWIPTQVLGQSFLLHQIRKMVCVAVDIARGAVPIEFIDKALSNKESLALHVAPAQGLFLEMSYFDGYNRRKNSQSNHDLLDLNWTVDGPVQDRWMQFRDIVRDHIVQEEENEMNFIQYLFR
jgi:tRNA pseudouridine38-40 synthase